MKYVEKDTCIAFPSYKETTVTVLGKKEEPFSQEHKIVFG